MYLLLSALLASAMMPDGGPFEFAEAVVDIDDEDPGHLKAYLNPNALSKEEPISGPELPADHRRSYSLHPYIHGFSDCLASQARDEPCAKTETFAEREADLVKDGYQLATVFIAGESKNQHIPFLFFFFFFLDRMCTRKKRIEKEKGLCKADCNPLVFLEYFEVSVQLSTFWDV